MQYFSYLFSAATALALTFNAGADVPEVGLPVITREHYAQLAFEKIKGLAGTWTTIGENGKPVSATFEVASGGSIVIGRFAGMADVYHLDGNRLMVTHYCSIGNQPRMVTAAIDNPFAGNTIEFKFLDITNLLPSQDGYINSVSLKFENPDTLIENWTSLKVADGKESSMTFKLVRKK